ncbi:MAG: acyl-homoserine-lactone synthase [Alphaproteobacteria bacterium]|jgi:acyl homoserine lactone synthase
MIIVIDALNRDRFGDLIDEMFRLRARVFGDRLGWEVDIKAGKEIDKFDHMDPAYVIGIDEDGHVVSCVRALQTTGPHMLADVFQAILEGEPPLRSANVWESTRFCVDTQRLAKGGVSNAISRATCELMIGSLEFARQSGITDIVTVIDPIMDRVLKRSDNAPYGYLGSTKPMGKVHALAALLDCSEERIARVRAFAGITEDVFASEDYVRDLLDEVQMMSAAKQAATGSQILPFPKSMLSRKAVTREEILGYCKDQLDSAESPHEVRAALSLVNALASRGTLAELVFDQRSDMN